MNIFNILNYKDFIRNKIQENSSVKGYQGQLAQASGCQRPYFSQVLRGKSHLSFDQAAGLAEFWRLSEEEANYFFELLHLERASTQRLKARCQRKIRQMKELRMDLAHRFNKKSINDAESESLYYSTWYWSAIHVLLSIPELRDARKIAQRFKLPVSIVNHVISGLEMMGLVKNIGTEKIPTEKHVHIPKQSPLSVINHMNWRYQSVMDASLMREGSVHYTGVHSLSRADIKKVRDLVLELIDRSHEVIAPSPPEELIYLGIDFFSL